MLVVSAMSPSAPTVLVEDVWVPVRIIAAPAGGVFQAGPNLVDREGTTLCSGEQVGVIQRSGDDVAVLSPHTGELAGLLVHSGERVREGKALAWVHMAR